jgi:hypothetical protein
MAHSETRTVIHAALAAAVRARHPQISEVFIQAREPRPEDAA